MRAAVREREDRTRRIKKSAFSTTLSRSRAGIFSYVYPKQAAENLNVFTLVCGWKLAAAAIQWGAGIKKTWH